MRDANRLIWNIDRYTKHYVCVIKKHHEYRKSHLHLRYGCKIHDMFHLRNVSEHRLPWAKHFRKVVRVSEWRSTDWTDVCGWFETILENTRGEQTVFVTNQLDYNLFTIQLLSVFRIHYFRSKKNSNTSWCFKVSIECREVSLAWAMRCHRRRRDSASAIRDGKRFCGRGPLDIGDSMCGVVIRLETRYSSRLSFN